MPRALRPAPVSIRLSDSERAELTRRAGSSGLSTYIKSVVLSDRATTKTTKRASADIILLAKILAQLGASGLGRDMRRLSEAADSGSLDLDDITVSRLRDACKDIQSMHMLLLQALGKKRPGITAPNVQSDFVRATSGSEVEL